MVYIKADVEVPQINQVEKRNQVHNKKLQEYHELLQDLKPNVFIGYERSLEYSKDPCGIPVIHVLGAITQKRTDTHLRDGVKSDRSTYWNDMSITRIIYLK